MKTIVTVLACLALLGCATTPKETPPIFRPALNQKYSGCVPDIWSGTPNCHRVALPVECRESDVGCMVSAGLEGTWCRVEDARGAEADPVVTPCEHQAYYRYYKAKAERLAAAPPKPFLIMTPAEEFVVRVSYFLSGHWSDAFSR